MNRDKAECTTNVIDGHGIPHQTVSLHTLGLSAVHALAAYPCHRAPSQVMPVAATEYCIWMDKVKGMLYRGEELGGVLT